MIRMKLPGYMRAMLLVEPGKLLVFKFLRVPEPSADQILIEVIACGVCRKDLPVLEDEPARPKLP
jgi:alcohol dehydrogenase, propanol-preferring